MLQTLQLPTPASRLAVESHGFNYIISLEVDGPPRRSTSYCSERCAGGSVRTDSDHNKCRGSRVKNFL